MSKVSDVKSPIPLGWCASGEQRKGPQESVHLNWHISITSHRMQYTRCIQRVLPIPRSNATKTLDLFLYPSISKSRAHQTATPIPTKIPTIIPAFSLPFHPFAALAASCVLTAPTTPVNVPSPILPACALGNWLGTAEKACE